MSDVPIITIFGGEHDVDKYLGIIFKLGKYNDTLAIRFRDKYIDMVEKFVKDLRGVFGWLQEGDIHKVEDDNKKCVFFNSDIQRSDRGEYIKKGPNYGRCTNAESGYLTCSFSIRKTCPKYKQGDDTKFMVNEIVIRKHGAIVGL